MRAARRSRSQFWKRSASRGDRTVGARCWQNFTSMRAKLVRGIGGQCRHVVERRLASIRGGVSAEKPLALLRPRSGRPRDPKPTGDGPQVSIGRRQCVAKCSNNEILANSAHCYPEAQCVAIKKTSCKNNHPTAAQCARFYPALKLPRPVESKRDNVTSPQYHDAAAEDTLWPPISAGSPSNCPEIRGQTGAGSRQVRGEFAMDRHARRQSAVGDAQLTRLRPWVAVHRNCKRSSAERR